MGRNPCEYGGRGGLRPLQAQECQGSPAVPRTGGAGAECPLASGEAPPPPSSWVLDFVPPDWETIHFCCLSPQPVVLCCGLPRTQQWVDQLPVTALVSCLTEISAGELLSSQGRTSERPGLDSGKVARSGTSIVGFKL